MTIHTEWIRYGNQNQYSGYVARFAEIQEALPAVIILQEIWGVDYHIRDITERFAKAGYVAFAPDLFARNEERPPELAFDRIELAKQFLNAMPLTSWRDAEQRTARLNQLPHSEQWVVRETLDRILYLGSEFSHFDEQASATATFLRESYSYTIHKGIVSIGFCMGGFISANLAAHDPLLRGAIIYYGSPPRDEDIPSIQCPLLGFYGELDQRITDAVPAFVTQMNQLGKSIDVHIYPNAPHAFFNDSRPSYQVQAARDSMIRSLQFLQKVLA